MSQQHQVIVVGGGLAGVSAAHTVLQAGGRVLLLDKNAFMGGNSTKATSGMNAAGTPTQANMGIPDTVAQFEEDTVRSGTGKKDLSIPKPPSWPLARVLTANSAPAAAWLEKEFGLKLDTASRLGGHSFPRTHRSKTGGKFPGMMITYALMQALEKEAKTNPSQARVITKARVTKLLKNAADEVCGVEYVTRKGSTHQEHGCVVLTCGGFGAGGLQKNSTLDKVRPDLMHLPTTNGEHCTGDGIAMATAAGCQSVDLTKVQVHPTGIINPAMPDSRVLFLAAEALRGEGGILIDCDGRRFVNELGTRDYVSGIMQKHNRYPYRLCLNSKATNNIAWHVKHYVGRKIMKRYNSMHELAAEMKVPVSNMKESFAQYNDAAAAHAANGTPGPFKKVYFHATPASVDDVWNVAIVTPVVHYTMGGVLIDEHGQVVRKDSSTVMPGLFAGGEVTGGVHGINRLGGSALLECVVYGRVAGASAAKYVKDVMSASAPAAPASTAVSTATGGGAAKSGSGGRTFTMEEVAKHNKEDDCWVVVRGEVLDVTSFMADHPGGKMAIMTFAGRDATEEFDMLHDPDVVEKYAADCVLGKLVGSSKL